MPDRSTSSGADPSLGPPGPDDAARLFEELYDELRRLASGYMRRQSPAHTLQTTALIGEVYLRLTESGPPRWDSRGHFMAVAARAMRSVLVDYARGKRAGKRHTEGDRIHLEGLITTLETRSANIGDLDQALTELEDLGGNAARAVRVVELRFFSGLTMAEIADALDAPQRTVERDWEFARAWLAKRLK